MLHAWFRAKMTRVRRRDPRKSRPLSWSVPIEVLEARISHLAYAPEIAHAMLQRQQASAVIADRQKIVEGAVGMVHHALEMLAERNMVPLDDDRKAAMVSNLLVVLCSHSAASPVINAGTIYQ